MLMFSTVGNNIIINYSCGLAFQLLGDYFHAIPRFLWSLVTVVICAVLSVAGKDRLSDIISNFVSLLGYWSTCFVAVLLIEDVWFRARGRCYDLRAWNQRDKLPPGIAAVLAAIVGYLAGAVPGISQKWFVGPIAKKIGGGDVGDYLSGAIAAICYFVFRRVERRKFKR